MGAQKARFLLSYYSDLPCTSTYKASEALPDMFTCGISAWDSQAIKAICKKRSDSLVNRPFKKSQTEANQGKNDRKIVNVFRINKEEKLSIEQRTAIDAPLSSAGYERQEDLFARIEQVQDPDVLLHVPSLLHVILLLEVFSLYSFDWFYVTVSTAVYQEISSKDVTLIFISGMKAVLQWILVCGFNAQVYVSAYTTVLKQVNNSIKTSLKTGTWQDSIHDVVTP